MNHAHGGAARVVVVAVSCAWGQRPQSLPGQSSRTPRLSGSGAPAVPVPERGPGLSMGTCFWSAAVRRRSASSCGVNDSSLWCSRNASL